MTAYLRQFVKDPQAVLPYSIQWGDWLDENGGTTLSTSTWAVTPDEPAGIQIDSSSNDTQDATVKLSGGEVGKAYRVTNHVVDSGGNEDDRTLAIVVQER